MKRHTQQPFLLVGIFVLLMLPSVPAFAQCARIIDIGELYNSCEYDIRVRLEILYSKGNKKRNSYMPELGHTFGIYTYTPWKVIYPLATYDRDKVAAALDTVRKKGDGPTPLKKGRAEPEGVVEQVSGRAEVFIFYDCESTVRNSR